MTRRGRVPRSVCIALALVAAASAATGCGSASGNAASESPAQSKFIAEADAICSRLNSEIVVKEAPGLNLREIARLSLPHAILEQKALRELSKLTPPPSHAHGWQQIVAYRRTLAEELLQFAHYAKANDAAAVQALGVSKERVHRELLALAGREGFSACSVVG
jgi:hypothetical protein